ncbi:helix-turn-helix domain-containing protein [Nocardia sp. NPDC003482]
MPAEGSTLARRALGRELQKLRKAAEVSQFQAARILGISPQTMGRLEDGLSVRSASDLCMNALCDHYGVSDDDRRTILAMAREVRITAKQGGGWWRADMDHTVDEFTPDTMLLDAAQRLTTWQAMVLPPIVRTADYRRAVAWTENPNSPKELIEERLERAAKQQRSLDDPSFTTEIILSEAALREVWGGPAVMDEQRQHLAEIGQRPNVSLRVVPFDARSRIGALVGSFSLLEFPILPHCRMNEPPIVCIEEFTGTLYLERSAEVDRYKMVLTELRRTALSKSDSSALISAI